MVERLRRVSPLDEVVETTRGDRRPASHHLTRKHGPDVDDRRPKGHSSRPVIFKQKRDCGAMNLRELGRYNRLLAVEGERWPALIFVALPPQSTDLDAGEVVCDGRQHVSGRLVWHDHVHGVGVVRVGLAGLFHSGSDLLAEDFHDLATRVRRLRGVEHSILPA